MKLWLDRRGVYLLVAGAALLCALAIKRHYSHAGAEELRWILAPTAWLAERALGVRFELQTGEGYLCRQQSVLISPACAGVNFFIVAFLSLVLGFGGRSRTLAGALAGLVSALALAYLATLIVNTVRIALSVRLAHLAAHVLGLTFHSVHRLLGVAVYLAGLLALCAIPQIWLSSRGASSAASRPLLVALGCYLGVTLLVPLAGGAAHDPRYWAHAVPVSASVGGVIALLFAARGRSWKNGRHAVRPPERSERIPAELGSR